MACINFCSGETARIHSDSATSELIAHLKYVSSEPLMEHYGEAHSSEEKTNS